MVHRDQADGEASGEQLTEATKALIRAFVAEVVNAIPPKDDLLDATEAGSLLGLQPGTMYDLASKGAVSFVRLFGKTLRFRRSVIMKLIADSEVHSTNSPTSTDTPKRKHQNNKGATDTNHSPRRRGVGAERPN